MKRILLSVTVLYVMLMALLWQLGYDPDPLEHQTIQTPVKTEVIGEVTTVTPTLDGCQLRIRIQEIENQTIRLRHDMGVVCYMDSLPDVQIGDIVFIAGTFSVPSVPTNPGQFNPYIYQKSRGVDLVCYTPRITSVTPFVQRNISWICYADRSCRRFLARLWQRCVTVLSHLEQGASDGVLPAMLLGDKSSLSSHVRRLYQDSGIAHVLAISALHVGLVSGVLYGMLRWVGISYYVSGVIGIAVTFAYGYMTGAQDASMRAAIMLMFVMLGAMIGRTSDILTSMGISMAVLVSFRVYKLYDAGFLLSYGSVLGIGYVYPLLKGVVRHRNRWIDGVLVTLSVWAVTMPVMLYFFGTFTPYAMLLNLIVIPLMTPVLVCGLLGVTAGLLSGLTAGSIPLLLWMAQRLVGIAAFCVRIMTALSRLSGSLPGACVILGAMKRWQVVFYYLLLVWICGLLWLIPRGRAWICRLAAAGCGILVLGMGLLCGWRPAADRVTVLDVGQGDSILLSTKQGAQVLVDGGSTSQKEVGQYVMQPALTYYGVRRLEYVVMTHADADHSNGICYLMEQMDGHGTKIGCLILPVCAGDDAAYANIIGLAERNKIPIQYARTGDCFRVAGLTLQCLSPDMQSMPDSLNDQSVVLLAKYPGFRMLLTGDISSQTEQRLLDHEALQAAGVDVLKVAHHGSQYSSSDAWLRCIAPRIAVISCGRQNRYGHPHAQTIERLQAANVKLYRTDVHGAVIIRFQKGKLRVYPYTGTE